VHCERVTHDGPSRAGDRIVVARSVLFFGRNRTATMMDVLYLGLVSGFFALSWVFVRACDRL
jgi:hypothetical protein